MQDFSTVLAEALMRVITGDAELWGVVALSLQVSLAAVGLAVIAGLPMGAWLALARFPGRGAIVVALNALMGLPPVVVGLCVYLLLSASGPLGVLGLLYTPAAMIIAQFLLVTPIVAALTHTQIEALAEEYGEQFRSLGLSRTAEAATLLFEGRYGLITAALAGFGRAIAEVGAVMIVGGNINHVTRVMTTSIALETSRGQLELALALGVVLMLLALTVNAAAGGVAMRGRRWAAHA